MNPIPRFSENKYYYPFSFIHLAEQIFIDEYDPDNTSSNDIPSLTLPTSFGLFNFKPWNYASKFDYTAVNSNTNKYISSLATTNNLPDPSSGLSDCTKSNCNICNNVECIQCVSNYVLYGGECTIQAVKWYFISPAYDATNNSAPKDPADLVYKNSLTTSSYKTSVSVFVKLLGWNTASTSYDILRIGDLKFKYDISSKDLTLYAGATTFATYPNFLSLFGTWVNISLGYHSETNALDRVYFPTMLNLQINFIPFKINFVAQMDGLTVNQITIPKESIGVYAKLSVWNDYLTGIWGIQSTTATLTPPIPTAFVDMEANTSTCITALNILTPATVTINCVQDYVEALDTTKYNTSPAFLSIDGVKSPVKASCPLGYYNPDQTNACSCSSKTIDMILNKNSYTGTSGDLNYCQKLDYTDFARNSVNLSSGVGFGAAGFTMEFWVYINTYVSGEFKEFNVKWTNHLDINISWSATKYISTCYPVYGVTTAGDKDSLDINPTKWTYIRCSAEVATKKIIHQNDSVINKVTATTALTAPTATTSFKMGDLVADSNLNKGVIFFSQIRLWKCYDCLLESSNKMFFNPTTAASFADLLHAWDPIYTANIVDMKNASDPTLKLPLTATTGTFFGYNALDLSNYHNISGTNKAATDFIIYPEDKSILTDFIFTDQSVTNKETFYGAWYFSLSTDILDDKKNGIAIKPYNDVNIFYIIFSVISILQSIMFLLIMQLNLYLTIQL